MNNKVKERIFIYALLFCNIVFYFFNDFNIQLSAIYSRNMDIRSIVRTQGIQGIQGTQGIQDTQGIPDIQGIQDIQGTQDILDIHYRHYYRYYRYYYRFLRYRNSKNQLRS